MSPTSSTGLGSFFAELKRRHVGRATLAYAAVVFVLLQAAEIVLPAFLPGPRSDAVLRVLVVASAVMLPVVLMLAWVYEITPQGIRTMESIDAEEGEAPPGTGRLLPRLALLFVTVVAATGSGLWWIQAGGASPDERRGPDLSSGTPFVTASTTDASGPIAAIAVLPLENLSPDARGEQDYFTAGMHEAVIGRLNQIEAIRVLSRTSTARYDTQDKSIPAIGGELGVDAVIEGSVLRDGELVQIRLRLFHAASETQLWEGTYDRDFVDVIALQREVADAIGEELEAQLAQRRAENPALGDRLAAADEPDPSDPGTGETSGDRETEPEASQPAPTDVVASPAAVPPVPATPEVQDAFMRGRFAMSEGSDESMFEAVDQFNAALEMDSAFTPALVGLAGSHLMMGLQGEEPEMEQLLEARRLAHRALERDPSSAEAAEVLTGVDQAIANYGIRIAGEARARVDSGFQVVRMVGDSLIFVVNGDSMRVGRRNWAPVVTEIGGMLQTAIAREESEDGAVEGWIRGAHRLEGAGRIEQALDHAREGVERFPDEERVYAEYERLLATTGRIQEAYDVRRRRVAAFGEGPGPSFAELEERAERSGERGYWEWLRLDIQARRQAGQEVSWVHEAEALVGLDRNDAAYAALEQARRGRDPHLASLRANPVWDPIRNDPRFRTFVRTLLPGGSSRGAPGSIGG